MALPTKHIIHQRRVLATLGKTAVSAVRQQLGGGNTAGALPVTPGPEHTAVVPPLPKTLIRDYVRYCGGDPGAYRHTLPAHLFPQWGFPLAARTLVGLPYPLLRVLNGGCRLEVNHPLPAGEPLNVSARLDSIDDNGRRAVLCQRVVTGTAEHPEAVVGYLYAIVPLGGGRKDKTDKEPRKRSGKAVLHGLNVKPRSEAPGQAEAAKPAKKETQRVPQKARELAYWRIGADAGLAFAMLTGDFNPVHWIKPYARAFGFKSTILHGFATMARAIEGLNRGLFAGRVDALSMVDVQFTRPLTLPGSVGLYVTEDDQVFVGDAPGGPAYLVGRFERSA